MKLVKVSPNSEWVVSCSANTVVKCWSVSQKGKEVFSMRLNMQVTNIEYDQLVHHVLVQGKGPDGVGKVALFRIISQ